MIPGAATGAALVIVGISLLETAKGLDFTPEELHLFGRAPGGEGCTGADLILLR